MSKVNIIKQVLKAVTSGPGYSRVLKGVEVVAAEEGKAEFELKITKDHLNQGGTLHGGLTATLVDSLSSYAIATTGKNKFGVSVDLTVSYIKAAMLNDVIKIKTETFKTGKTLAFAKVEMYNQKGEILATGSHTKYVGEGVN